MHQKPASTSASTFTNASTSTSANASASSTASSGSGSGVAAGRMQGRVVDAPANFARLQARLAPMFDAIESDPSLKHTVVVVPGMSLDQELLSRIDGLRYYEERQLTMLMLLRMPSLHMVFVTSAPIDPAIIDYYLNLLPGIPHSHARRRLTLLSAYDSSNVSLTRKILDRPRLVARIRAAMTNPRYTHLSCFNATELERELALALDVPVYAADPALAWIGGKEGGRSIFREAGVPMVPGREGLRDLDDVVEAIDELVGQRETAPSFERVVVKLNEGASGEGNAILDLRGLPSGDGDGRRAWLRDRLQQQLQFEAENLDWTGFAAKLKEMGGIVEAWVNGEDQHSPSVQLRISPLGKLEVVSTHDQLLGGASGQKFLGSVFPANLEYRLQIQQQALQVGEVLLRKGVIGRVGIDFVVHRSGSEWKSFAIEINLRKGGTTHTFQTLQYLTDGQYDDSTGDFHVPTGPKRVYHATDNLQRPEYRRLTPPDLIDIAVENRLLFDQTTLKGVTFNLIGALSEFGKLGLVSIAGTAKQAEDQYLRTIAVLDAACGVSPGTAGREPLNPETDR